MAPNLNGMKSKHAVCLHVARHLFLFDPTQEGKGEIPSFPFLRTMKRAFSTDNLQLTTMLIHETINENGEFSDRKNKTLLSPTLRAVLSEKNLR